jgi:hypothetical protein
MTIAELEYGQVIAFESKRQYCFEAERELFTYKNYIELNCSFEYAVENYGTLLNASSILAKHNLCAGKTLKEFKA